MLSRHLERADELSGDAFRDVLDRLEAALAPREPALAELARELRWRTSDAPLVEAARQETYAEMQSHLAALAEDPHRADRDARYAALVDCPQPLAPLLTRIVGDAGPLIEAMTRRYYRIRELETVEQRLLDGVPFVLAAYWHLGVRHHVAATLGDPGDLPAALRALAGFAAGLPDGDVVLADLYAREPAEPPEALADLPAAISRIAFISDDDTRSFARVNGGLVEALDLRGLHPMMAERMDIWRLSNFALERLPSADDVYLLRAVARENPRDERLVALAEVSDLTPVRDETGRITALPELERMLRQVFADMRAVQSRRPARDRLMWNRLLLYAWQVIDFTPEEAQPVIRRFARLTAGLGLELVELRVRLREGDEIRDRVLRLFNPTGRSVMAELGDPPRQPLQPLDEGAQRIVSARRRGLLHPAEIVKLLAGNGGEFIEHDLDAAGRLEPVDRPPATNRASIVVGLIRNRTERYPEGMLRVALLGDPTRALGSLAEPECARVIAALDLAEGLGVPVEWFALSSGAKIAMDSGTENMDWVAAALRRIVEFTQAGGEINVVVTGINVGAQPYWNAEATMLMHTKGILVMTPESAMVLTGKQALDYSGGVSAEDNIGIGGYERVMGPNGQAQFWAPDLAGACEVLLDYYEHAYVAPGERFPRRAETSDPAERDIGSAPHIAPDSDLATVGEIFSEATNPGRKKPFDIRSVMRAVADADHEPLERWAGMREAEVAVTWDAHLGGWPVALLGIESRPLPRYGAVPADGPEGWTSGTLFPQASKKIARAINAASGRRPLVVLANLAGFDGSPESMRRLQLEYGAEIGRAIVNFDGPIAFCVISRFHGGAFVVFSRRLNPGLETIALEGAHASVIGGAPAAAVVFARDVDVRTREDARVAGLDERIRGGRRRGARAPARGARRALVRGPVGEAGRAGRRVRRHPQRPARGRRRLRRPHHRRLRAAPAPDRGDRARDAAERAAAGRQRAAAGAAVLTRASREPARKRERREAVGRTERECARLELADEPLELLALTGREVRPAARELREPAPLRGRQAAEVAAREQRDLGESEPLEEGHAAQGLEHIVGLPADRAAACPCARSAPLAARRGARVRQRGQPRREVGGGHRPADEVALGLVAAPGREQRPRLDGLDALRHDLQAEPAAEVDQRVHDRVVAVVAREPHDERAVDLERVDVELAQVPERGMPGPEVVERRAHADRVQAGEDVGRALHVGHHDVLGHLELEPLGRDVVQGQQACDLGGQAEVEQVGGPEVDGDADAQRGDLLQRAVEHEPGQRPGQPALLHQRQELARAEQAADRVLPAHERLDPVHRAGLEIRLRLVVDDQLARLERAVELADQREPLARVVVARGQVDLVAGAQPLGLVHRHVGALEQAERVGRVLREQGDADAGVDVQPDVGHLERALERGAQPQRGGARGGVVARREDDGELVAAEPRERVLLAQQLPAAAGRSGAAPRRRRGGRACR